MKKSLIYKIRKLLLGRSRPLSEQYPEHNFGRGTYCNDLRILNWGEDAALSVGAFCSIGKGVQIYLGGEHRTDWLTTYPFNVLWDEGKDIKGNPFAKGDVVIGNDVWIGREAVILSGVTVGDGAVIGARSVVSRDVPPYSVVTGNPARKRRERFPPEIAAKIQKSAWWEWDEARIKEFLPKLLSGDYLAFFKALGDI